MNVICKECGKEFELDDPTFIMLFERGREIYCVDCIWEHPDLNECNSCKNLIEFYDYNYCSFNKGSIYSYYCEGFQNKSGA